MLHFGTDGVRGVAIDELTPELARDLARATSRVLQPVAVVIGRDTRESGPALEKAIIDGCAAEGVPVYLLGVAPTPAVAFASERNGWVGIAITASHNSWSDNGIKVFASGGVKLDDAEQIEIERVWHALTAETAPVALGTVHDASHIVAEYATHRFNVIGGSLAGLSVVLDCAHGAMSSVAAEVFHVAGASVEVINASPNGRNINEQCGATSPQALAQHVIASRADLGIAFDGDGDRVGVVTNKGHIVYPDRLMMLFALDVLSRNPGADIIYDVKCSRLLHQVLEQAGGKPQMWKTGHSLIKARMKATGALLAGEMSGHFFFSERWFGFDDGIYAAARLLEILAAAPEGIQAKFDELPKLVSTPELKAEVAEGEQHAFIARFVEQARFEGARISLIDGVRADWPYGWGLVRASNTTPVLVLRFEANDEAALSRIQAAFRMQLLALKPDLNLPF